MSHDDYTAHFSGTILFDCVYILKNKINFVSHLYFTIFSVTGRSRNSTHPTLCQMVYYCCIGQCISVEAMCQGVHVHKISFSLVCRREYFTRNVPTQKPLTSLLIANSEIISAIMKHRVQ